MSQGPVTNKDIERQIRFLNRIGCRDLASMFEDNLERRRALVMRMVDETRDRTPRYRGLR